MNLGRQVVIIKHPLTSGQLMFLRAPGRVSWLHQLQNTSDFYLPPNTTSKLLSCNGEVIHNPNLYYQRYFNRLLMQRLEDKVFDPDEIDILQAIRIAVPAWSDEFIPTAIFKGVGHCLIRSQGKVSIGSHSRGFPFYWSREYKNLYRKVIKDLKSRIWQVRYNNRRKSRLFSIILMRRWWRTCRTRTRSFRTSSTWSLSTRM